MKPEELLHLTPQQIVEQLDQHIVGQKEAKRAVAIALRNRLRRKLVPESIANEITPKNILMIGPTGVGKTEIARRLARLAGAPFIKIEATKFTEVGYVGRDVESIIRDLVDIAMKMTHMEALDKVKTKAKRLAEEQILDILMKHDKAKSETLSEATSEVETTVPSRESLQKNLRKGKLNNQEIEIELTGASVGVEIMAPPGMEEMTQQLQGLFQHLNAEKTKKRKVKVKEALGCLQEEEAHKLLNEEEVKRIALDRVEQSGIVFLDEIDKVTHRSERAGQSDVSREGVQRDLLPLIEGCTVSTKYGSVRTDHILFIASGAFHLSKPSDLIPELQGRLPIRVELKALTSDDFVRILTEPNASLTEQYEALLATESVQLAFSSCGIKRVAELAFDVNERTENIGARRLHTVMERLLEDISFRASEFKQQCIKIDRHYVNQQLSDFVKDEDLSRFIL